MPQIDYEKLYALLFDESLPAMLTRAEAGDVHAASEVLPALAVLLSSKNVNPQTGQVIPVPNSVRDYLSKALSKIVAGVKPMNALNLTRNGSPGNPYFRALLGAYLFKQNLEEGENHYAAGQTAADMINEMKRRGELVSLWMVFDDPKIFNDHRTIKGKKVDWGYSGSAFEGYYHENKEIRALVDGAFDAATDRNS